MNKAVKVGDVVPIKFVVTRIIDGENSTTYEVRLCGGGGFMMCGLEDFMEQSESDGIALAAARAEIRILQDKVRELVALSNEQAFTYYALQAQEEARSACG